MTFSIVARNEATGDLAVAVQTKFMAAGAVVPWARAGVGAVATQAWTNVAYGPDGLDLLESGADAAEAVRRLIAADPIRDHRQLGIVDASGRGANHTGGGCFAWAGGRTAPNIAAQGNILAGPGVVDALIETFSAGGLPFPRLLVRCLAEADAAGGDRRGRESAALLVVRAGGAYGGGGDRWIDLRVDDHPDPIGELARLLDLWALYFERPAEGDLRPLDQALAGELRQRLSALGYAPGARTSGFAPMSPDVPPQPPSTTIGSPRPLPAGWDEPWQTALTDWMSVENLEERAVAPGWVDPRVVEHLRRVAASHEVATRE
jgi:uncharacterized Ntn-hydrolase superfamily protein